MSYVIVLMMLVTSCGAQDLMTCSRTSDTFQLPSALPSTPSSPLIGRPGKQGAVGQKGAMGVRGEKGDVGMRGTKGQKGESTDEEETDRMKGRIAVLEQQLGRLTIALTPLPEPGWLNGINGYQYKLTDVGATWQTTRTACQALGGDLAVHGMQSDIRKYIYNGISGSGIIWIGLRDLEEEGTFRWVDGTLSTPDNTAWYPGEPNGGRTENCAMIYPPDNSYRFNDGSCSYSIKGICEKHLTA